MLHTARFTWIGGGYARDGFPYFNPISIDGKESWYSPYYLLHDGVEHWPHGIIDYQERNIINECIALGAMVFVNEIMPLRTSYVGWPSVIEAIDRHVKMDGMPCNCYDCPPSSDALLAIDDACPDCHKDCLGWINIGYKATKEKIGAINIHYAFSQIYNQMWQRKDFAISYDIQN